MSSIWTVARKEFLANMMSHRFVVTSIVACATVVLAGWALLRDYKIRAADYHQALQTERVNNAEVRVWRHLEMWARKPPSVLTVISRGIEGRVRSDVKVTFGEPFVPRPASAAGNPLMNAVPQLDLSLVAQVVLGLLALLMAYDAINGEREDGTLMLMLAGSVPRWAVISGKLIAGMATVGLPCLAAFLLVALVLILDPDVAVSGADWVGFAAFFAVSALYLTALFSVGVFVSALARPSAVSLAAVLAFWVFAVVLAPNLARYAVSALQPGLSPLALEDRSAEVWKVFRERLRAHIDAQMTKYPKGTMTSDVSYSRGYFPAGANRSMAEENRARYSFGEPLRVVYANQEREVRLDAQRAVRGKASLSRALALPTLASPYGELASLLAGTDLGAYEGFLVQARAYRGRLYDYLSGKTHSFRDLSYFSRMTEEDVERYTSGDRTSYYNRKATDYAPLNVSDAPVFTYRSEDVPTRIKRGLVAFLTLMMTPVLFSFASAVAFSRMDVTHG